MKVSHQHFNTCRIWYTRPDSDRYHSRRLRSSDAEDLEIGSQQDHRPRNCSIDHTNVHMRTTSIPLLQFSAFGAQPRRLELRSGLSLNEALLGLVEVDDVPDRIEVLVQYVSSPISTREEKRTRTSGLTLKYWR